MIINSVAHSDEKDGKIRFDQVIMDWVIALLVKTSKSVYNDITKIMKVPSSSWVMRNKNYLVKNKQLQVIWELISLLFKL